MGCRGEGLGGLVSTELIVFPFRASHGSMRLCKLAEGFAGFLLLLKRFHEV